jgi:dTMP kinase
LEKVVRPHRAAGDVVIIDGYVAADFAWHLASAEDLTFVQAVNQAADRPDLAVTLTAEPRVLAERRQRRRGRRVDSSSAPRESERYRMASEALARASIAVLRLETSLYSPDVLAAMIEVRLTATPTLPSGQ